MESDNYSIFLPIFFLLKSRVSAYICHTIMMWCCRFSFHMCVSMPVVETLIIYLVIHSFILCHTMCHIGPMRWKAMKQRIFSFLWITITYQNNNTRWKIAHSTLHFVYTIFQQFGSHNSFQFICNKWSIPYYALYDFWYISRPERTLKITNLRFDYNKIQNW